MTLACRRGGDSLKGPVFDVGRQALFPGFNLCTLLRGCFQKFDARNFDKMY